MTRLHVLRPGQHAQWLDVLAQSFQHDFYHLPSYHTLAEEQGEGQLRPGVIMMKEYNILGGDPLDFFGSILNMRCAAKSDE